MFWKKKDDNLHKEHLNSDEYERLLKRLLDITTEVKSCQAELKLLQSDLANLRGNFNRKLAGIAKEESAKEKPQEEEKFINSNDVYFG